MIVNCITCNKKIYDSLYNSSFLPNLFTIIVGFLILGLIVLVFAFFSFKKYKRYTLSYPDKTFLNPVPLSSTAIILGMGIGGFIDGILFHQILQWHGMVSNKLPIDTLEGKAVNMFWDGIFHAITLITVIIGIISLVRLLNKNNIDPSAKLVWGGFFAGWGIFNFIEGLIHHQIIGLHNVNEFSVNPNVWNYGFLASGLIFMFIGFTLIYKRTYSRREV